MLFFLIAAAFPATAADPVVAQAEALLKEQRAAEAYELLLKREDDLAGDPSFDYVFGVAALDSGHPDVATLAFERVLAVDPDFAGARLDMARAYFNLGDLERARSEFRVVLEQNPPPQARAAIERYLKAIEERERAKTTLITGFLEATVGFDTNVNNSTSQASIAVPALGFLVFTLDPKNVQRHDKYLMFAGGAEISHQLRPGLALFAGAGGRHRANKFEDQFDLASVDGRAGIAWGGEKTLFRLSGSRESFYLDRRPNRHTGGLAADVRYALNEDYGLTVFGQKNRFRFQDPNLTINDFNQTLVGVALTRNFGKSSVTGSGFYGHEGAVHDRADGDKLIEGARAVAQLSATDRIDVFASAGFQQGYYNKINAAFQTMRSDKLYDGAVGMTIRVAPAWSLRPQITHSKNDSNIPIYLFRRTDYSFSVRFDFR